MKPITVPVNEINELLPQTQCRECGFSGCLPYAQAIQSQTAPLNLCAPGGEQTLLALGNLLNCNVNEMPVPSHEPRLAKIEEAECVGCTKCIQACPVDAIMGANKYMHVVLTHECTGCGLCVDPCPVNCISLHPAEKPTHQPEVARARFEARQIRLLQKQQEKEVVYHQKRKIAHETENNQVEREAKLDYIVAALNRVKTKHE